MVPAWLLVTVIAVLLFVFVGNFKVEPSVYGYPDMGAVFLTFACKAGIVVAYLLWWIIHLACK